MQLPAKTRLAPSPTGTLHLGNIRTFLVNWALARQRGWRILLRIEDLDTPRVKSGVTESMLRTLEAMGITWDEGPLVQSSDLEPYRAAMRTLAGAGRTYPSPESRAELEARAQEALSAPQEGVSEVRYPAEFRPAALPRIFEDASEANWRFAASAEAADFDDGVAGPQRMTPAETIGDFVIWTKRHQPAYQLAVVVDDARQGITHIVRGNDLLDSAGRQILLQRALGIRPQPAYFHLPLVRGEDGKRLAKRHGDTRVESYLRAGVPPERIIALIARWSGVENVAACMTASEFASAFQLAKLPAHDVVFHPSDDVWLKERKR
ncbi:MAG: tRNA glutamyl-Q(34) synthetase GluQRS [Phycisphaerales bacterium]